MSGGSISRSPLADRSWVGKPAAIRAATIAATWRRFWVSMTTSSSARLTEVSWNRRWWCTSTMLPPCPPMTAGHPRQRAGHVGQLGAQPHEAAARAPDRASSTEARRRASILPPVMTMPTLLAAEALGLGQQRRDPGGAGALGDQLLRGRSGARSRASISPSSTSRISRDQRRDDPAGQACRAP